MRTLRHAHLTRAAAAGLVAVSSLLAAGCSDATDDFCGALASQMDLSALRRALDAGDDGAVTRSLDDLQEVRDLAPPEIAPAAEAVIDTAIDTVRRVTQVTGPNGETMPVDTAALNRALAEVAPSAQQLSAYADEECDITLR